MRLGVESEITLLTLKQRLTVADRTGWIGDAEGLS